MGLICALFIPQYLNRVIIILQSVYKKSSLLCNFKNLIVLMSFGTLTRKKCAEIEIDNVIKIYYNVHIIKGLH